MAIYFVGVDVGSGSARAGVFDQSGRKYGEAKRDIQQFRPRANFVEQSSDDIWQAVCQSVRDAVAQANINPMQIKGIGFDATCSLVVLNTDGEPLTVSPTGRHEQNIVMWMDHRAIAQAERVNATKHPVLAYVGNRISPEMQMPKLLWLKENMPQTWQQARYFFDLPDFLTWKATGDDSRSLCSTVCKWTYLGHEGKWDDSFFQQVGLAELLDNDAERIGSRIKPMAEPVGQGLCPQAADALGLLPGTAVGTSIIDAHAGGIGVLGAAGVAGESADFDKRLALIGGTSSCHMAVSKTARFIDGIWGAYYSAMIPGHWLNEGGQSATGALVDHVISSHPYYATLLEHSVQQSLSVYQLLNQKLLEMAGSRERIPLLTRDIHVLPYFHGNRSPRANPNLTGTMTGLTMSKTLDNLALQYLATIQAISFGTRHIIEEMNNAGYRIDTIMACGGGTKNPVFLQEHANATNCTILLPEESEAVLLGSAMLGSVAAGFYGSIPEAMTEMSRINRTITPQEQQLKRYYDAKYQIFHRLYEDDLRYKQLMAEVA